MGGAVIAGWPMLWPREMASSALLRTATRSPARYWPKQSLCRQ